MIRMTYNGQVYEGKISDGMWVVGDREFDSPSGAASGIAITKKGKSTRLDGWIYWEVRQPGEDNWVPLDSLRSNERLISDRTAEELGL